MANFYQFDQRLKSAAGGWGSLPPFGRAVVGLFALPGIFLAILSLLLFAVSMLALLVLTVPVYGLLMRLTGGGRVRTEGPAGGSGFSVVIGSPIGNGVGSAGPVSSEIPSSGTRRVDSTVVE